MIIAAIVASDDDADIMSFDISAELYASLIDLRFMPMLRCCRCQFIITQCHESADFAVCRRCYAYAAA